MQKAYNLIQQASRIVILTGAGMSTASGIPDFRSSNGLYERTGMREYYLSRSYYNRKPKDFWRKYKEMFSIKIMGNYQPNQGHYNLSSLENFKKVTVLTQNIDGLHQEAGSLDVIEMHGTIQTATCPKCKRKYDLDFINSFDIPRCVKENSKGKVCNFILRPDVVLFGDNVQGFKEAESAIGEADLFLVLGSSLEVLPINKLPLFAKGKGVPTILVNNEETKMDNVFDYVYHIDILNFFNELEECK